LPDIITTDNLKHLWIYPWRVLQKLHPPLMKSDAEMLTSDEIIPESYSGTERNGYL